MALDFRKQAYIEWLCTPPDDRERSEAELAAEFGVKVTTMRAWKRDVEFIEEWQKLYLKTIGNPGVKQEIMETLRRTATDPDDPAHVRAAEAYFKIEGSLRPQMDVKVSRTDLSEVSDEELAALAAQRADDELRRRREAS